MIFTLYKLVITYNSYDRLYMYIYKSYTLYIIIFEKKLYIIKTQLPGTIEIYFVKIFYFDIQLNKFRKLSNILLYIKMFNI